jgi:hypothetical protein
MNMKKIVINIFHALHVVSRIGLVVDGLAERHAAKGERAAGPHPTGAEHACSLKRQPLPPPPLILPIPLLPRDRYNMYVCIGKNYGIFYILSVV